MAVSSGALGLEAAVILGDDTTDEAGVAVLRNVAPSATVFRANADGTMAG
jgi:trehalose-6-phosphatase